MEKPNQQATKLLLKGNLVTIVHRLPYSSVSFYAYEQYKSLLHTLLGENLPGTSGGNLFVPFVGGGMAGITAASATYLLQHRGVQFTIEYRGIWHAFHTICRDEGFWGSYKGLVGCWTKFFCLRDLKVLLAVSKAQ